MNGAVVVDASLAVKLLVREVQSDLAVSLTRGWLRQGVCAVAPYLMVVEVSKALFQKARRGQFAITSAGSLLDSLLNENLILLEPPGIHSRALELAHILQQRAAYDSHYLALADSLDCEYWTADERYYRAASGDHPRVRWIGEF